MGENNNLLQERLVEYEKAQDSAEHYNTMVWTLVSIGIGFSLTILYKVWTVTLNDFRGTFMLYIGFFSLFYFGFLIESANEKRTMKYKICQEIEKRKNSNFLFCPNVKVDSLSFSGKDSKKGINMFRVVKYLFYSLYLLTIIVQGYILACIIFGLFFLLFLVIDFYYLLVKENDYDKILGIKK